jgi:hypothetical protein
MRYRDFLFRKGDFYPHQDHESRIENYYENKQIFEGNMWEVFERHSDKLSKTHKESLYVSSSLGNLICKKISDFIFGESVQINAGEGDDSPEQKRMDQFVEENNLNIVFYENAITNSFKGDGFFRIRYGQNYNGLLPKEIDPYRIFIENQPAEFTFPETDLNNHDKIIAYHIAYPFRKSIEEDEDWRLQVESHYPGYIEYSEHYITPFQYREFKNEIASWRIGDMVAGSSRIVETKVPFPLIVHCPNFSLDDGWRGQNEIDPIKPLLRTLNDHLTFISKIIESHSDPILALPSGSLSVDENGNPHFDRSLFKVLEIMEGEQLPEYVTWEGNLNESMQFVEKLIENILSISELPAVAIGKQQAGTSGASGVGIRFMMSNLLSKSNRKRQYYEKALSQVFIIAQLLEHSIKKDQLDYKVTKPKFVFRDGLPRDLTDESERVSLLVREGLMSKKAALMYLFEFTEKQAEDELTRIEEDLNTFADPSIFNSPSQTEEKSDIKNEETNKKETEVVK